MSEYGCEDCGATYEVGVDGDLFTTITVSYHDPDREDFSISVCPDCGDDALEDVVAIREGGDD